MAWKIGNIMSEAASINLQQIVYSVVLIDDSGYLTIVGSSFVISNQGTQALCLSATHVFEEIFSIINKNKENSRFSYIPQDDDPKLFDITPLMEKNMVKVLATIGGKPYLCNITSLSVLHPLDSALLLIESPLLTGITSVLALNSDPLPIGTEIILVSYSKQKVVQAVNGEYTVSRETAVRIGKILSIENDGSPLVKAPVYLTNIPCDPGMSGGPVFIYDSSMKGKKTVCGIISSDMSSPESFDNCEIDGHSYISLVWPCGALNLRDNENNIITMLDLEKQNRIVDYGTAFSSAELEMFSGGKWQIRLRT